MNATGSLTRWVRPSGVGLQLRPQIDLGLGRCDVIVVGRRAHVVVDTADDPLEDRLQVGIARREMADESHRLSTVRIADKHASGQTT